MTRSSLKILGALVCDDVRFEIGGKYTVVGVYGPELNSPDFPCVITLRVVVFIDILEAGEIYFEFRLVRSEGEVIGDAKGGMEAARPANGILLPLGPFTFTFMKPGSFKLQFQSAPGRWKTVQKWNFAPPPTSPTPTSP